MSVSDLSCLRADTHRQGDELGLNPNVFYTWQKQFFQNGHAAFQGKAKPKGPTPRTRLRMSLKGAAVCRQQLLQDPMRLVFGSRTERTRDVVPKEQTNGQPQGEGADDPPGQSGSSSAGTPRQGRQRRKGHGRIPAAAYAGCERVILTHQAFSPGDPCPDCQDGTLYRLKQWAMTIRLVGQPPIGGTRYEQERLRCGTCGKLQVAELPEDVGPDKYDSSVASVVATLRYGEGGYRGSGSNGSSRQPGFRLAMVLGMWLWVGVAAGVPMASYQPARLRARDRISWPSKSPAFRKCRAFALGSEQVVLARRLSDAGELLGDGRTVVLEPEHWVGKRFPLLDWIETDAPLDQGRWTIVLYRPGCPACEQVRARYQNTANAPRLVGKLPVCFKSAGTWRAETVIAGAAMADGLGFDVWFTAAPR